MKLHWGTAVSWGLHSVTARIRRELRPNRSDKRGKTHFGWEQKWPYWIQNLFFCLPFNIFFFKFPLKDSAFRAWRASGNPWCPRVRPGMCLGREEGFYNLGLLGSKTVSSTSPKAFRPKHGWVARLLAVGLVFHAQHRPQRSALYHISHSSGGDDASLYLVRSFSKYTSLSRLEHLGMVAPGPAQVAASRRK